MFYIRQAYNGYSFSYVLKFLKTWWENVSIVSWIYCAWKKVGPVTRVTLRAPHAAAVMSCNEILYINPELSSD
jgi:hypothetical protein